MISAPGLSGHELPICTIVEEAWRPLTDELTINRLGSLLGLHRGTVREPSRSVLVAAHMDAIGLMVTGIEGEFLRITGVGGVDGRILPGQLVVVHASRSTREELPGIIAQPPPHLLPEGNPGAPVGMNYLWIDLGLTASEVAKKVRVGDLVSFAQPPIETAADTLTGHSLDNRASVAALTYCLEQLQGRQHEWDLWAIASSQEEVGGWGAQTSAFGIRPTIAIALDVTFGSGPGSASYETFPFGKGLTLGWGPDAHPGLYKALNSLAESLEIPCVMETMPRHSGTDATNLQVTQAGIPSAVVSIPLRYMHTPVEMVSLNDITRAGRLLAEFVAGLDDRFMDYLTWED